MSHEHYLERLTRLGRMPERVLDLTDFRPSPRRIVARWAMLADAAAYRCHFAFFVRNDGTVLFYNLFGHQLRGGSVNPDWWNFEFDFREAIDMGCRGDDAELRCHFSKTIRLPRRVVSLMLRSNSRGFVSLESSDLSDAASWFLNAALEDIFWTDLVDWLPLAPKRRASVRAPDEPFPTEPKDVVCNVPLDASSLLSASSALANAGAPLPETES